MNIECAKRQSFGARYEATASDKRLVNQLLQGMLAMSPHPTWELPEVPTWLENPFDDNNWQFQYHSLRWLDPLRREAVAGDDAARLVWERYAQSWLAANPAGSAPSKWAWTDMGDALRTFELVFATTMYKVVPNWLVTALEVHAAWLADHRNLGHGNHALHQHQALFVVARVLEDEPLVQLALSRLESMAASSYDAQGVNEEGSISYQEANFHWWNEAIARVMLEGIDRPSWADTIALAPESLAHATQPNGKYVRLGDMDGGSPSKVNSPFTDYVSSSGSAGIPPSDLIKIYDRGYIYGRSGWGETERNFEDETFFSISFGEQQKIHGHADGGSITYFASGRPWIVDTGKFTYGSHPMRRYVVNRDGHNLLFIRNKKYDRSVIVNLFRTAESDRHFEAVTRDTGYDGVLLTRRTIYSKHGDYLLVLDAVSADSEVEVHQRWHIDENSEVQIGSKVALMKRANSEKSIYWLGRSGAITSVKGNTDPLDGWTSVGWRKSEPTTVVTATQKAKQITFRTVIGASTTVQPNSTVRNLGDGYQEIQIHGRNGLEYVLIGKNSASVSDTPFDEDKLALSKAGNQNPISSPAFNVEDLIRISEDDRNNVQLRRSSLAKASNELERIGINSAYRSGLVSTMIDLAGDDLDLPSSLKDSSKSRSPIINWDSLQKLTHRSGIVKSYTSRTEAARDSDFSGLQTYRFGNLTMPVKSLPGDSNTLHVTFHGALDRGKYSLPRFERAQSLSCFANHQLIFADPTLDLDPALTLGWYLGAAEQDLHLEIARFVQERMKFLGSSKVILSGSSGGGFAALQVSALLNASTVLAFNPQTAVTSYHQRLAHKALNVVFPDNSYLHPENEMRVKVSERFLNTEPNVQIIFIQNDGDTHHSIQHRIPFLNAIEGVKGVDSRTITESWGAGHRSPSSEGYIRHLTDLGLLLR
ncbi:heparinase II/III domain-containing protein [Glutamicibacter sp. Je.9.36]|uniref:heparinase II/III domain-containing protein n=1 Tax=Glutamicibacter sp. Je.9.36 TaxID=3142837 RepID=UPI003DA80144